MCTKTTNELVRRQRAGEAMTEIGAGLGRILSASLAIALLFGLFRSLGMSLGL